MEVSAHDGDTKAVMEMIASGMSVNQEMAVPGGGTALHQAAFGNNKEIANFLITQKADLNALTQDGRTPLLCCVNGEGSFDVAKILLEAGCDKNSVNKNSLTALDCCVRAHGQDELETMLREHDVEARSHLTNWRQAKKAVKKIQAVTAFVGSAAIAAKADAEDCPLSPSARYRKSKAEGTLGDMSL